MRGSPLEALLGAFVVVAAVGFAVFVFTIADPGGGRGYELVARFDSVEGLSVGSEVRLGGIRVGSVVAQDLDPVTYLAVVRIGVDAELSLPVDTAALVVTEGLLGGRYLSLVPGVEEDMLTPGDEIRFTQSAVNVETLIGRLAGGQ